MTTVQPELDPNRTGSPILQQAVVHLQNGDLENAGRLFKEVITDISEAPAGYYGLGMIALRKQDRAAALKNFGACLSLDPKFVGAAFQLSRLYAGTNDILNAIKWCMATLRLEPQHLGAGKLMEALEVEYPEQVSQARLSYEKSRSQQTPSASQTETLSTENAREPKQSASLSRFSIPNADELDEYVKNRTAIEKEEYKVRNWTGKPLYARVFNALGIAVGLLFAGFVLFFLISKASVELF